MKIRIGNDFVFNWAIERGGLAEDLSSVLEAKLTVSIFGKKQEVPFTVSGNIITIEFTPEICNVIGSYNLLFTYILPDLTLSDEDRKCAVDVDAFQIVAKTAQADDSTEFSMTSDMAIAFKGDKGDSAYQVWLDAGNTGTEEDYFAYLRQPATDAGSSISELEGTIQVNEGLRVQAESERDLAEATRIQSENERLAAEIIRQSNEGNRIENEATRVQNEAERISKENVRQSNEIDRVEAESERVQAESERVQAESEREITIQEAVTATNLANEKANLANTAAQSANEAADYALTATQEATTAASLADTARLAIQGDLAQKADHGYESIPKTLKQVDDKVLEVDSNLAQLESEVEQLAYVKIKNEAVNGNFENGLTAPFFRSDGFGGASTLTINSSAPISGNYDIRLTITTPATGNARPILYGLGGAGNIGDKIYLHFYAKILSGTPILNGIHNGITTSAIYGGDVINGRNTRIIDAVDTGVNLGIIYFDSTSVWDMQMDNFIRINLTKTFGVGNEPTEEEIDLLISTLGIDYFEGEITIPAQKVMQWQLALIRKNKNAIIALGGTII